MALCGLRERVKRKEVPFARILEYGPSGPVRHNKIDRAIIVVVRTNRV